MMSEGFLQGIEIANALFAPLQRNVSERRRYKREMELARERQLAEAEAFRRKLEAENRQRQELAKILFPDSLEGASSAQPDPKGLIPFRNADGNLEMITIEQAKQKADLLKKYAANPDRHRGPVSLGTLEAANSLNQALGGELNGLFTAGSDGLVSLSPNSGESEMSYQDYMKQMAPQAKALFLATGKIPDYAQEYQNYLNYMERKRDRKELRELRRENLKRLEADTESKIGYRDRLLDLKKEYNQRVLGLRQSGLNETAAHHRAMEELGAARNRTMEELGAARKAPGRYNNPRDNTVPPQKKIPPPFIYQPPPIKRY